MIRRATGISTISSYCDMHHFACPRVLIQFPLTKTFAFLLCLSKNKITTSGDPGLFDLDNGFEGSTAYGAILFHAPTTPEIANDASAAYVEDILETLPSIGQVGCLQTFHSSVQCGSCMTIIDKNNSPHTRYRIFLSLSVSLCLPLWLRVLAVSRLFHVLW